MLLAALITATVAIAGGFAGHKLKLPAGFMVGSLLASGLLNALWAGAWFPMEIRVVVQILAGAYIGMNITRANLVELKKMFKPALALFLGITLFAILSGFLIYALTDYSFSTSMLATVPGGIVDMSLISLDLDAQPQVVAALQLERLVLIMTIFPFLLKKTISAKQKRIPSPASPAQGEEAQTTVKPVAWTIKNLLVTLLASAAIGYLLFWFNVPAGAIVGALIGAAGFNILSNGRAHVPVSLKSTAQVAAGLLIGQTVNAQSLAELKNLYVPALVVLVECLAIAGVMGFLLWKIFRVDLPSALFGSVPAGLTDMVLISIDEGGDPSKVMLLQLVRYVGVISLFPTLIKLLGSFL